jgi:protein SCO1
MGGPRAVTEKRKATSRAAGWLAFIFLATSFAAPQKQTQQTHDMTGLLLAVDPSRHAITVSCREIPGYMEAMVMSFRVKDPTLPTDLKPGVMVNFTLILDHDTSIADGVHVRPFESLELDPTEARRLKLVENASSAHPPSADVLHTGDSVPDFRLTDQNREPVSLSQFRGKIVALTFVYTRCPLPDYCVRLSNNFGVLQRRFKSRMGQDIVLLTVVIDPVHDQPAELQSYARTWKADPHSWHFLTGPVAEIQRICRAFDMSFYPDEGLFVHSFHTVVIGRSGRLAANLDGNSFTAQQLGDLIRVLAAQGTASKE